MFDELANGLPQNEMNLNVDVAEDNETNNNVSAADRETKSSEAQHNIRRRSSLD